jgi:transposase-like protein
MILPGATQMKNRRYPIEFKELVLNKAHHRGTRTLGEIAAEVDINLGTLKDWLKSERRKHLASAMANVLPDSPASQWSSAQRLLALQESYGLEGEALHAWCRERGIFEHQLNSWRDAFCADPEQQSRAEFKALQVSNDALHRELQRKERALAETAALLVLQKKYRALLGDEDA